MNFGLNEEQEMIVSTVRSFVENEIYPHEDAVEKSGQVTLELGEDLKRKCIDLGFYACNFPEEVGGAGLSHMDFTLVERELGRGSMALTHFFGRPQNILMACEGEQRERYLLPAVRGEKMDALAITEPDAGSDVRGMKCQAVRDGGDWVLSGSKHFISGAEHADFFIVFVATGVDETPRGPKKRITCFLVDRGTPGFEVRDGYNSVSHRGYKNYVLYFDKCRLPDAQVLGEVDGGFDVMNEWLYATRLTVAAMSVGRARRCFDLAVDYAVERKQFGQSIAKFQGVSFQIADMITEIDAADWLTLAGAWRLDQGLPANREIASAKVYATEMLAKVTDTTLQIFGGMGLMDDFPIERFWRDARVERIWDGTSEIQRHIISRDIFRPWEPDLVRGLGRLLQPETIAVIGGGTWCENVIRECRKGGFAGDLWAVHPRRREIGGCAAVSSLADLPSAPDVAFVGVNRHATVDIIRDLSRRGGGGAVCFASGFSEAIAELEDGSVLQEALVDAAGDMPILGPNCYGFINALDQATLWPDQHGLVGVDKGVAIISQSSNIALNLTMQARGLPIAYLMTVGNQAQTGLSAIGQALLADDRVTAVGLHIEGIDDLSRFEQFARKAHEAGKPIVALKVGKSDQARAATVTHTASLAGTQVGASALFNRLGIAQVDSLPTLLEALKLVHVAGRLSHAGVASLSCSGGEASLVADAGAGRGVVFPPLTELQKEGLRAALGPKVALANPLDYHTYVWGDVAAMSETFSAMVSDEIALGIVVLDFPRSDRCDLTEWLKVIEAIEIAANRTGRPMAVLSTLAETLPEKIAHDLIARNIVPLCGVEEAMEAIRAVSRSARPLSGTEVRVPVSSRVDKTLGETEAKEVLARFGLKTPVRRTADNGHDAAEEADRIGFPVVLKGTGFSHKSEVGAVRLNLQTAESVAEAAAVMPSKSFLVEKMVTGTLAELLVGVVKDPAHGFILTLAAGGVLTELLQDRVSLVLPVERHDVADALQGLRIAKVIAGYRGKPACDPELIIDAVMAVQDYVCSSNVDEVEINPLMCGENFAIAADALIRFGDA